MSGDVGAVPPLSELMPYLEAGDMVTAEFADGFLIRGPLSAGHVRHALHLDSRVVRYSNGTSAHDQLTAVTSAPAAVRRWQTTHAAAPSRWMTGAEAAAEAVAELEGADESTAAAIARDVARGHNPQGRGVDGSEPAVLLRDFYAASFTAYPVLRDLWNAAGNRNAYGLPATAAELLDLVSKLGYRLGKNANLLLHDGHAAAHREVLNRGAADPVCVGTASEFLDASLDAQGSVHQTSSRCCEGVPAPGDHTVEDATGDTGGSDAGGAAASPLGAPRPRSEIDTEVVDLLRRIADALDRPAASIAPQRHAL